MPRRCHAERVSLLDSVGLERVGTGRWAVEASGATLRAYGEITREDVVRLLTRPGAAALLGPTAGLDLTLGLYPA